MYSVLNVTHNSTVHCGHCGNIGHEIHDFALACALARKYDFDGINIDLSDNDGYSLKEKKELLKAYNLIPAAYCCPLMLYENSTDQEFEESLALVEKDAESLQFLGFKLMLCYLPPFAEKLNFNDNFLLVRDRLKKVKPLLQAYGLKLGLEFIGPTETRLHSKYDFIHTIDGVRCLIASADLYGLAGFKLDVHHWENSGAGLLDLKHLDIDYVLYVELNDGKIGYDRFTIPEFARELPLATHVTHVIEFLSELAKKDYAGPVTVEPWNEAIQQMGLEEAIKIVKASLDTVLHQAGIVKKLSAL